MNKPKVKLFQWWMLDNPVTPMIYSNNPEDYNNIIERGVWETYGVEVINDKKRIYTLRCIMPLTEKTKFLQELKVDEEFLIITAHQVELKSLPKIK